MANLRWSRRTDYENVTYRRYAEARRLLPEAEQVWLDRIKGYMKDRTSLRVLDVGSGTGRFAPLLARGLGCEVVGVESSDQMLSEAVAANTTRQVQYVRGNAELLPFGKESFDLAWLSMVIHHIDRDRSAEELARVLRPAGMVLIRNTFRDRLIDNHVIPFYTFFPGALDVDLARLPSTAEVISIFERKGFLKTGLDRVNQILERSLKALLSRLRKGGISTLDHLSEAQREEGFRRLEIAAENERKDTPVMETIDLLVLTKA
jgi:ubiquinone/menaquinone biosynthesis C-methylase UbiE